MSQQTILSFLNENQLGEEFRVLVKKPLGKEAFVAIKIAINGSHKTLDTQIKPYNSVKIYHEIVEPLMSMGLKEKIILNASEFDNNPSNTHFDLPDEIIAFIAPKLAE